MTDFERRLRAAMAASAGPAPAGLLDGIHLRHRRHHRRIAVACAAVLAFGVAGTLIARGVLAGPAATGPPAAGPAATGPAIIPSAAPSSTATRAPGTVLRDCQSSEGGTLGWGWKAHSIHAGPVWFMYERPRGTVPPDQRLSTGKVTASAMAIAVENGHTAVVRAAPELGGRFRFLASFHGGGQPYTMAEGAPGLTLSGCAPGPPGTKIPEIYAPGLTMFWEGYVTDLRGCIPVEVRATPASQPIRVTLAAGHASCGS
jgi:hypothetical protein